MSQSPAMPDRYDRLMGLLDGLTDTLSVKPSTIPVVPPLGVGGSESYIVQTYRQQHRNEDGRVTKSEDTIFLVCVNADGSYRVALPAAVADAIARQRDALNMRSRTKGARERAQRDKAAGVVPGFLRGGAPLPPRRGNRKKRKKRVIK